MAIINTFQKCLDSPYLFEDKEAPNRIVDLLAKAGDRLDAAVNIHTTGQGDPADVVFLSYEAMFSCVRALVYAKGYREFGLRCLLTGVRGTLRPHRPARCRASAQVRDRCSGLRCRPPRPSRRHRRSSSARSSCWVNSRHILVAFRERDGRSFLTGRLLAV